NRGRRGARVERVDAGSCAGDVDDIRRSAGQAVVASSADQRLDVGADVIAFGRFAVIRQAVDGGDDRVGARGISRRVISSAADQAVGPLPAVQGVVAAQAADRVIARTAN